MVWVARIAGLLVLAYGALGIFFAVLAMGQGYPLPVWNEQAWSVDVRYGADWAVFIGLALGGLLLLLGQGAARLVLLLALAIAAAKTGYDLALGDPTTARQTVIVRADFIALAVCAVALLLSFAAPRRAKGKSLGSAQAS